jgi:hypothetical protein
MPTDEAEVLRRAEELYNAWTLLEEAVPSPGQALTFSDLVAFLSEGKPLTHRQQRALFSNPTLRAHYDCLKRDFAVALPSDPARYRPAADTAVREEVARVLELPALVAAADGDEPDFRRRFNGGALRICPVGIGEQVYVIISLDDPATAPRMLVLESTRRGKVQRIELPARDADGEILIIKDLASERDAEIVDLLRDPTVTGIFLR